MTKVPLVIQRLLGVVAVLRLHLERHAVEVNVNEFQPLFFSHFLLEERVVGHLRREPGDVREVRLPEQVPLRGTR